MPENWIRFSRSLPVSIEEKFFQTIIFLEIGFFIIFISIIIDLPILMPYNSSMDFITRRNSSLCTFISTTKAD